MSSTRAALEAALAADPDDLARHAAYADLLIEEGDPRGEFIRLQLALEDPDLPAGSREAMDEAVAELLQRHEAEWLGPLAWYVRGEEHPGESPPARITWRRGWPDQLNTESDSWHILTVLRESPIAKLLRKVVISQSSPPHEYVNEHGAYLSLAEAIFRPLLETAIRNFHFTQSNDGDVIADELIRSGLISKLRLLNLSHCHVTDDGAVSLAACPDVRRLKSLSLDDNLLSPIGLEALAAVGFIVGPQLWDAGRGRAYV